jgi:hypothetical protein
MEDFIPFGGPLYFFLLAFLLFARGMDFLSTWVATPNLLLEANPIARRLGWRLGILVNLALCAVFASWPLPAIVIITTSLLVAARNFQSAWMMRSFGEDRYRSWVLERMGETRFSLYLFCVLAQSALVSIIGFGLMYFSPTHLVAFAVGLGIVTYGIAISVFTLLSVWRMRQLVG